MLATSFAAAASDDKIHRAQSVRRKRTIDHNKNNIPTNRQLVNLIERKASTASTPTAAKQFAERRKLSKQPSTATEFSMAQRRPTLPAKRMERVPFFISTGFGVQEKTPEKRHSGEKTFLYSILTIDQLFSAVGQAL